MTSHVMFLPGMEASPMATVLPLTPRTEIVSGNAKLAADRGQWDRNGPEFLDLFSWVGDFLKDSTRSHGMKITIIHQHLGEYFVFFQASNFCKSKISQQMHGPWEVWKYMFLIVWSNYSDLIRPDFSANQSFLSKFQRTKPLGFFEIREYLEDHPS